MAEDLTGHRPASPEPVALPPAEPRAEPHPPPREVEAPLVEQPPARGRRRLYRGRFLAAYAVLGLAAGAAVGATLLLFDRPPSTGGGEWSEWQPSGRESSYPRQIADYVSQQYRLSSGNQLVAVSRAGRTAVPVEGGELPVSAVVIQHDPQGDRGNISVFELDDDVMYVLCGRGDECTIGEGRPSRERMLILRREALELALYTFKYTAADSVITLMPPLVQLSQTGSAQTTQNALFFHESDFDRVLERPLTETFTVVTPPTPEELGAREAERIEQLTDTHAFQSRFEQAPDGSALLLLTPFEA